MGGSIHLKKLEFEKARSRGVTRINHLGFENILRHCFGGEAMKEAVV